MYLYRKEQIYTIFFIDSCFKGRSNGLKFEETINSKKKVQ